MRNSENRRRAKRLAISAMLTALICVILSLGVVFETLDLSFATIAALIIWIALLEYGRATAWSIYIPSAVIALFLLPSKFPALFFAVVTGWYPMFKLFLKNKLKSRALSWAIKLSVFNAVAAALIALVYFFGSALGITLGDEVTKIYIIAMLFLCNTAFVVTDILMDKLVIIYIMKIRDKLVKLKIVDNKERHN